MITKEDKVNAIYSLKNWAAKNQLYETAMQCRDIERTLLEADPDIIMKYNSFNDLSEGQRMYLSKLSIIRHISNKALKRELILGISLGI